MKLQTLVATMHRTDHSLLEKMNIRSDAIVGNQCDRNEVETFLYQNHQIKWLSFAERGVGLNRNNTLMRADGDIVLFADDDVVYCDDYAQTICHYYETHPEADVVIFNFRMRRGNGEYYERVRKEGRANSWSVTRYGTYCISARTEKLKLANVHFHLMFGGGSRFSSGEDSIFLQDCIKKGLKVYTCRKIIGTLDHGQSTWFQGYTDKFFYDKGVAFAMISKSLAVPYAAYHCLKHRKLYSGYGWNKGFRKMCEGIRYIRSQNIR